MIAPVRSSKSLKGPADSFDMRTYKAALPFYSYFAEDAASDLISSPRLVLNEEERGVSGWI
jgi:hypothetical protein